MSRQLNRNRSLLHLALRLAKRALVAVFALEAGVISMIVALGAWRKHTHARGKVPPQDLPPLTVGAAQMQVYTSGAQLYDAMLDAIRHAEQRILIDMFIWKGDRVGREFKAELASAAQRGVEVYVIFDGFANLIVPPSFKRFPPSIHTLKFRVAPKPWRMFSIRNYGRDHHKLVVVDGKLGFMGGYNIGDPYATHWRDTSVRLSGPPVWDVEHVFIDFWNTHAGSSQPRLTSSAEQTWMSEVRLHRNVPKRLMFPIRSMYVEAIDRAQHHIYLTHAYFLPDRTIMRALLLAAQRGVDVRLLLPERSNHVLADWLAHSFYSHLLRGGVKVLHYRRAMLHAKTATIDGMWSTIGTANIDRLSLEGNYEINLEVFDAALAHQMEGIFVTDSADASEVTFEAWQQRRPIAKLSEAALAPLWPLL
ncbi:MAG: phospholipase D-like domain-containing protein [Chloroflexota bacterium]|nr:phospholipase D-like domain-containing protein [Chloroflexota bacterium]